MGSPRYYAFDEALARELLGKKLSKGTKKELDEVSARTGVGIRSCRRQVRPRARARSGTARKRGRNPRKGGANPKIGGKKDKKNPKQVGEKIPKNWGKGEKPKTRRKTQKAGKPWLREGGRSVLGGVQGGFAGPGGDLGR